MTSSGKARVRFPRFLLGRGVDDTSSVSDQAKRLRVANGAVAFPMYEEADVSGPVLISPVDPYREAWRIYRACDLFVATATRIGDALLDQLDVAWGATAWGALALLLGDFPPYSASRVASHLRLVARSWDELNSLRFSRGEGSLFFPDLVREELGPMFARWECKFSSDGGDLVRLADVMTARGAPCRAVVLRMIRETWRPEDPRFVRWFAPDFAELLLDEDLINLVSSGHPYAEPLLKAQLLARRPQ